MYFLVVLTASVASVRGQSALDGFDPNANSQIFAIVVQPDGKLLVGGQVTMLAPNGGASISRAFIARLNVDGTVDTAFNVHPDSYVRAIALQADGKIVIGGDFNSITPNGGSLVIRRYIARLNHDGTLDLGFDPWADATVSSLVVQPDGKILAGGSFTTFFPNASSPGITRRGIARIDPNTSVPDSFNPNANINAQVRSIALQPDGKVLVGGTFTNLGGQPRNYLARLDGTSGGADSWNPNANATVWQVAVQADGKILAAGDFSSSISTPTIGGQTRNRIARLDPTTGLADSWNPNANNSVRAIALQADGKILVGGAFSTSMSIGGQARNGLARLDAVTGLADSFDPNLSGGGTVNTFAVQPDGKILIGGGFATLSPNGGPAVTRNCIARLEISGRLDQTVNLNMVGGWVTATAVQPDGKILIAGRFNGVLGVTRHNIARLNTDGTLDLAFDPNADFDVNAIAVQAHGKILVGGQFQFIGAVSRNRIARLDATTGAADSFDPNASSNVYGIAVQPDGKILVSGAFVLLSPNGGVAIVRNRIARLDPVTGVPDSFDPNANATITAILLQADGKIIVGGDFSGANSIGGATRNRIARLDGVTGLADGFNPNANIEVDALAVQADGKILAGGNFTTIGGATRHYIARLDATTGAADAFDPNASDAVVSLAVQADGKILAAGLFNGANSIGGATRNRIARLDPTTGLADSWDATNANNQVQSIAIAADGKILAGGNFTTIGGQTINYFARLSNDTEALQNLGVAPGSVTWVRGGASVQFTRVTFESSADNVTYAFLGNGTASGTNWILSGLNLPTGQNIYVRARGYVRSGFQNGSESIMETVQKAFLSQTVVTPNPLLSIQPSAATNVVLSWSTDFAGFTLESNTNLTVNAWSVVLPGPAINGTNNVVTNTVTSPGRFYRLRK